MNDAFARNYYLKKLTDLANEIRDLPGSCERLGHDWTPWERYVVAHDFTGLRPPEDFSPDYSPDLSFQVASRRSCHQCGKEQLADD